MRRQRQKSNGDRWKPKLVVFLILLLMGGCATRAGFVKPSDQVHCAGWKPIFPHPDDTAETKRQVLEHDVFGAAAGCWDAPGKGR